MEKGFHTFRNVTLLITHYNRSSSLERLLETFRMQKCMFDEIVVSDDGSKPAHLNQLLKLQDIYHFRLITTPRNKGLGHNLNKGQDAVNTLYTLYVQEDFVPKPVFPQHFRDGLEYLENDDTLDMIRFYAYFRYPFLRNCKKRFCEMVFRPWPPFLNYRQFYYYSDHPHLRRSTFLKKFGRYPEGMKGDATEYSMMMSVLQKKGKALFYEDFKGLFDQVNSSEEPSTMTREYWRQTQKPLITILRNIYRHLKFNYNYLFTRYRQ